MKRDVEILRKKLLRNLKDYGIWISLKKGATFFLRPIYQKTSFILYELDLQGTSSVRYIDDSDFVFKCLDCSDDESINQIEEMEEWLSGQLRGKLRSNGICMAVIKDGRVAGFNLASVGEGFIPLLRLRVITQSDEAWSEQISVHKDYRRRGLASELRARFYKELERRGVKALYGHRQEFNVASKRSARNYTARQLVKTEYRKVFGHNRLRYEKLLSNTEAPTADSARRGVERRYKVIRYLKPTDAGKKALFTARIGDFMS